MDNNKDDKYFVDKIRSDIMFIKEHMKDIDIDTFSSNEILLDSMLFRMIQISENANKLSKKYKNENKNIPWQEIYGMRNRIVHDYGNVDLNILFETLTNDIPSIKI